MSTFKLIVINAVDKNDARGTGCKYSGSLENDHNVDHICAPGRPVTWSLDLPTNNSIKKTFGLTGCEHNDVPLLHINPSGRRSMAAGGKNKLQRRPSSKKCTTSPLSLFHFK